MRGGETVDDHRRRPEVRRAHARRQGERRTAHPPRRDHPRAAGREGRLEHRRSCRRSRRRSCRVDPRDGAIRALVGGFDFNRNKFNHVTQALRQPGSSFKPFIYSAALEKGFTAATIINDAPLTFSMRRKTGSEPWEPKNYDGKYEGPMRLRTALAKSKNLVSIRILQAIGPQYAQDYITALRLRSEDAPAVPHDGARRRQRDADADGAGVLGVRQRRLSRAAVVHRAHRGQPRQRARCRRSRRRAGRRRRARDRPAQRLHHAQHHARRRARWAPRRAR